MERIKKKRKSLVLFVISFCPLLINKGIASTCHTEGGKTIREERKVAIMDV
jgi:hypothetical protein